jgi:hypothetical protein
MTALLPPDTVVRVTSRRTRGLIDDYGSYSLSGNWPPDDSLVHGRLSTGEDGEDGEQDGGLHDGDGDVVREDEEDRKTSID